ncbi:DUF4406 domain-containing protein [Proteiniclasticum sp. QWL-01]|uniref:DUF4406 domain-containing protein n=1 Tax=Proteiniclasticum sp. QWL-01 TaxID=3036945 RepID=UPI002410FD21|nr:DUF4406 domain-containing protein [Proteiniclasticum sp. QWL-01]WFF74005.1 DUF4406 domain-containing protein [Proteiniclasticum sp. QWL-01]
MKLVYLAHPYGGMAENGIKAVLLEYRIMTKYPEAHIFNAVRYFSYFGSFLPEVEIMRNCLDMVARCDELWVAPGWRESPGCKAEVQEAASLGMKIRYLTEE